MKSRIDLQTNFTESENIQTLPSGSTTRRQQKIKDCGTNLKPANTYMKRTHLKNEYSVFINKKKNLLQSESLYLQVLSLVQKKKLNYLICQINLMTSKTRVKRDSSK